MNTSFFNFFLYIQVMIFSPLLMFYLWICLEFYNGQLQYPTHPMEVSFFLDRMMSHVLRDGLPTPHTITVYLLFIGMIFYVSFIVWVPVEDLIMLDFIV